jgi:hypothetical protein
MNASVQMPQPVVGAAEHIEAPSWTPGVLGLWDQGLIDRPEVEVSHCVGEVHVSVPWHAAALHDRLKATLPALRRSR